MAHYYRNLWAFGIGVVFAYKPNIICKKNILILGTAYAFLVVFNWFREGFYYAFVTTIAMGILMYIGLISQKYEIKNRMILYLGTISYYLYLCHRTVYNLLWGYGMTNFVIFVCLSIFFGVCFYQFHKIIQKCHKKA